MKIKIGDVEIGDGCNPFIIAEIGINHMGSAEIARQLIDAAKICGADAVKFQKRTIEVVYTPEELAKPRENPFGTTNGDLKYGLEFEAEDYREIDAYCKELDIAWFASCWDENAVDMIDGFNPPCYKIASAGLTDDNLLKHTRAKNKPVILSTGMSSLTEIDHAVEVLGRKDLVILHSTSTYPSNYDELNLKVIPEFRKRYGVPVGYSGHETGIASSVAAVALGACVVERHITLERSMWGSDHAASLGPSGITRLVRDIRLVEMSFGDGVKKVFEREKPIIKKLRRTGGNP
ncbi:MAG: N-acetylneuraminate synthase family protein [Elusimicrobiota bacterium]|nr:N-acetylneuraminate synthase family protein [Elusimicrobiota bacterium]